MLFFFGRYTTILFVILFSVCAFQSMSQKEKTRIIKGIIRFSDSTVCIGASIDVLPSGSFNAISNGKGLFTIQVPKINDSVFIHITYIGAISQTIGIGPGQSDVSVVLQRGDQNIGTVVVVAAPFVSKTERSLTYLQTALPGSDFTKARNPNVIEGLEGQVAGVSVTPSSAGATGAARVIVRGATSISPTSSNQPLYVVDGIPIDNTNYQTNGTFGSFNFGDGIQLIDPDEIATFTILKGAAASALYGYRAANGVILITSKTGGGDKGVRVELNSTSSIETPLVIPRWQTQYGQGQQGLAPTSVGQILSSDISSWGGKLNGSPIIQYDGVYRPYTAQTNNYSIFYKPGATFTNSVSVGAGNAKNNFFLTLTDLQNQSVIPNSSLVRDNFAINANLNPIKNLDVNITLKYVRQRVKNRPITGDSPGNPNYVIEYGPTSYNANLYRTAQYTATGAQQPFNVNYNITNPYWSTNQFIENDQLDRFIGGIVPTYHITPWLDIRGRMSLDYYSLNILPIVPVGTTFSPGGSYGAATLGALPQNTNYKEYNGELLLRFNKRFARGKIGVDAFLGGNNQINVINTQTIYSQSLIAPIPFYDVSNALSPVVTNINTRYSVNSVYGSVEVDYKRWLYLTVTGRNDWFSTLSSNRNSSFYPSIGAGFVFSNAFKLPTFVNFAKFSTSYGVVGSATAPYQTKLNYFIQPAFNGNTPTVVYGDNVIPSPNLVPYNVRTFEATLEAKFLNNLVGGNVTFYNKNTVNDIVNSTVSYATGFTSQIQNVGNVLNRGVELGLYGTPISRKRFTWNVSYNMSYNESRVVSLSSSSASVSSITVYTSRAGDASIQNIVGLPAGQLVVSDFSRNSKGQIIFSNGLPQKSNTLVPVGTVNPPYIMGITNEFDYKNFSLSFLIDGKFGAVIYSNTANYGTYFGKTVETLNGRIGGVLGNGVDINGGPNTIVVSAQNYYQSISGNANSIGRLYVYSANFIKLRQVIFGYSIPNAILKKARIKALKVSIVGRNLAFLYKEVPNIDPEANVSLLGQGIEYNGIPSLASVGLNINIKF